MGRYWQGNSAGRARGGIVGPKPSPKTAPILDIEVGSDTSQYGNISGWKFPQFDESTSAVVRISASGRFIEDVDLSLDDVQVLHGASINFDGVNLTALGSDRTSFVYDVGTPVDEDITIEMLSFDHNGQQLFP